MFFSSETILPYVEVKNLSKPRKVDVFHDHSWDEMLTSSVRESLERIFGKSLADSIVFNIGLDHSLDMQILVERLQNFFQEGSRIIELEMAKNLYHKMFLPFTQSNGQGLLDYLIEAKKYYDSSKKISHKFQGIKQAIVEKY